MMKMRFPGRRMAGFSAVPVAVSEAQHFSQQEKNKTKQKKRISVSHLNQSVEAVLENDQQDYIQIRISFTLDNAERRV